MDQIAELEDPIEQALQEGNQGEAEELHYQLETIINEREKALKARNL